MTIHFKRISDYCLQAQDYTIAKVKVYGVWSYEVWHMNKFIRKFDNSDDAKKYLIGLLHK